MTWYAYTTLKNDDDWGMLLIVLPHYTSTTHIPFTALLMKMHEFQQHQSAANSSEVLNQVMYPPVN